MRSTTFALSLLACFAPDGAAQELLCESQRIVPAGLAVDDQFGYTVAAEGDTLAVTAINQGRGSVSIYVLDPLGWQLQQVLESPQTGNWFGFSLALDGDRLAIGRPKRDVGVGGVDLFTRSAGVWSLEQSIPGLGGYFGLAIDLQGDRLLIGAPLADHVNSDAGAAYVYVRSASWQLDQQLSQGTTPANAQFGSSVALDGALAVVGRPGKTWLPSSPPGRAVVYRMVGSAWQAEAVLRNAQGSSVFAFGQAVALHGNLVAVSEPNNGDGAVHLFEGQAGSWSPRQVLRPPHVGENIQFGSGLALRSGELLIGPRYQKTTFYYTGGTPSWTLQAQLAPALETSAQHEQALALSADWMIVGNRYEPEGAHQGGAVRIYARPLAPLANTFCAGDVGACPCGNETDGGSLAGCTHSAGVGGQIVAAGSASLASDDLQLFARRLPGGAAAFLFSSSAQVPAMPAGDGTSCLGASVVRHGLRLSGALTWGPGILGQAGAAAGETWSMQVALRDGSGPCGTGFTWTQALAVTSLP